MVIHDKISGCFHSLVGAEHFTAIRSYLQTAAGHDENPLAVLRQLFTTDHGYHPKPPAGPERLREIEGGS